MTEHELELAQHALAANCARDLLNAVPGWAANTERWLAEVAAVMSKAAEAVPPGRGRDAVQRANGMALDMLRRFIAAVKESDVDAMLGMIELWPEAIAREAEAKALSVLADEGVTVTEGRTDDGERVFRVTGLEEAGFDVSGLPVVEGPVHRLH
jgi:hypothetical protein